jgi:hypothetical protein
MSDQEGVRALITVFELDKLDDTVKLYNTVILTVFTDKEPQILPFPDEAAATMYCKMYVKDWMTYPETSYKVVDDYNILLYSSKTPAVLITREYNMLLSSLGSIGRQSNSNTKFGF